MTLHTGYLIFVSALFLLVFGVMMSTMLRHSPQRSGYTGAATGAGQWLWMLVPLAILAVVTGALFRAPIPGAQQQLTLAASSQTVVPGAVMQPRNDGAQR